MGVDIVKNQIGLAEAAQQLRLPYQDAHRLLLTGALRGKKVRGRWLVDRESVQRLLRQREQSSSAA